MFRIAAWIAWRLGSHGDVGGTGAMLIMQLGWAEGFVERRTGLDRFWMGHGMRRGRAAKETKIMR